MRSSDQLVIPNSKLNIAEGCHSCSKLKESFVAKLPRYTPATSSAEINIVGGTVSEPYHAYSIYNAPRKWLYYLYNVLLEWYGSETVPPTFLLSSQ